MNWAGMSIVAVMLFLFAGIGLRGAATVSFDLLLAYFWCIIFIFVPLILALFSCFNFNAYTGIYFRHTWDLPNFQVVRNVFCPKHTADTLCLDQKSSAYYPNSSVALNSTVLCQQRYNTTDCVKVRSNAINKAISFGFTIMTVNSFLGAMVVLVIVYSLYICQHILTLRVISLTMLEYINYLLILPIAGCIGITINFWFILDLHEISGNFFPYIFLALTVAQVIALPIGIASEKFKSRKLLFL
jgi:hypothetical protein